MVKVKSTVVMILFLIMACLPVWGDQDKVEFTQEEIQWIEDHKDRPLSLGLDPYSGMDYFNYKGKDQGYIIDLVNLLEASTGLDIEIVGDKTWHQVYQGLATGDIDILFGANVTPERLEFMSFTSPIHKNPYAVFVYESSPIKTIGDLDQKRIGFIEGDIAIDLFKASYTNIEFEVVTFPGQPEGLAGLENHTIDGFITSGGGVVYDFMYHYPEISFIAEIQDITSDMTLATLTDPHEVLRDILSKVIDHHQEGLIDTYIKKSQVTYNIKLLNLTEKEYAWLVEDGRARVGVVSDYLPFDYYDQGDYKGVAGEILKEIEAILGIEFDYVYGDFDAIYAKALKGEVEILNIAKTEERLETFLFPQSYSEERDLIYGKKASAHVQDIYGLEGKRVAVIKGFWHQEFLEKNLRDVEIIYTDNIKESLKLVNKGKVDYLIENPTVAEYYIGGLGYWNIIKKGETSTDSFLYFGVHKDSPYVASILDKALTLINYDLAKQRGLDTVPALVSRSVTYMFMVIVGLLVVIGIGLFVLIKIVNSLIKEREASAVLKAREHMMYLDALTGLNNRLYYNSIEDFLSSCDYPQSIIISDLNNLKTINDSLGHHVGDAYIKAYGDLLKANTKDAIICRMGGDEFMIINLKCDGPTTEALIQTLRDEAKTVYVSHDHKNVGHVEAAYGYAIRDHGAIAIEEVTKAADNNMYADKKRLKDKGQ